MMDSDVEGDYSSDESDRELQIAFQTGLLKPGLNIAAKVPEKKHINDKAGLEKSMQSLIEQKKDLPWIERLDMTVEPAPAPRPLEEQLSEEAPPGEDGVHDDFRREMKFYRLAQAAVLEAVPRLKSMGIPTKRPEDYFAEMAKSDTHMKRIREKLLSKQVSMERSAKAKKMRELRKYGKKVQQEVLQKRQKEKKEMMTQVKKFRKGQADRIDFLDESRQKGGAKNDKNKTTHQVGKKREYKNTKFGYGGQKKRSKYNTAESANQMSDYSKKKHGTVPAKYVNKNKKSSRAAKAKGSRQRLGKERRNSAKQKKK